jgi:glyoxylase-like metal-dependent hydrolase (beta-lactamase superfamily II)
VRASAYRRPDGRAHADAPPPDLYGLPDEWVGPPPSGLIVVTHAHPDHYGGLAALTEWLANIARLRADMPAGATLHPGHGEPCGLEVLDWQDGYIGTVLDAVREADWTNPEDAHRQAVERIRASLPRPSCSSSSSSASSRSPSSWG